MTHDAAHTATQRRRQRERWSRAATVAAQQAAQGGPTLGELRAANQARIADERHGTMATPPGRGRDDGRASTALPTGVFSGFSDPVRVEHDGSFVGATFVDRRVLSGRISGTFALLATPLLASLLGSVSGLHW